MAQILKPEAYGNPKAIVVRIKGRNSKTANGQRRHDLRIGIQPKYVDVENTHKNRIIIEPWTGRKLKAESVRRRDLQPRERSIKSNAGIAIVGIIAFGSKAQKRFTRLSKKKQDAAFREIAEAVAVKLNTTLTGLVVHLDETSIHAHFQLVGYDLEGNAISQQTKKRHTSQLQDLAAEIITSYDAKIERGHKIGIRLEAGAAPHEVVNREVNELHRDLPKEIERRKALIRDLQAELEDLRKRKDRTERLIARIEAREKRTIKQEKNLAIYEQRLSDRTVEIDDREARIASAEASTEDLEQRQRRAERNAEAAERRAAKAHEMEESSWAKVDEAERKEAEAKARTLKPLSPNHIDDLPAPLREAVDTSAEERGYVALDQMHNNDKQASINNYLRTFIHQVATSVYHDMAKSVTDLRRRLRGVLGREKVLQNELQEAKLENAHLKTENQSLKEKLSKFLKPERSSQHDLD